MCYISVSFIHADDDSDHSSIQSEHIDHPMSQTTTVSTGTDNSSLRGQLARPSEDGTELETITLTTTNLLETEGHASHTEELNRNCQCQSQPSILNAHNNPSVNSCSGCLNLQSSTNNAHVFISETEI